MAYAVGAGILKRMAQYKTEPATAEDYRPRPEAWTYSEAFGKDGRRYVYLRETNQVLVFDADSAIVAGSGPDPALTIPAPTVIDTVRGNVAGTFAAQPLGVVLHSTRSGQDYNEAEEFSATVRYVRNGAAGLGWNVSIGPNVIATHIQPRQWGWHARSASSRWLAAEFAQSKLGGPISDEQVQAFCWWFRLVARAVWPDLPRTFPNHSDLAEGKADGKSDPEPAGQHSLRDRILAMLA